MEELQLDLLDALLGGQIQIGSGLVRQLPVLVFKSPEDELEGLFGGQTRGFPEEPQGHGAGELRLALGVQQQHPHIHQLGQPFEAGLVHGRLPALLP